jgi:hypothetical protein
MHRALLAVVIVVLGGVTGWTADASKWTAKPSTIELPKELADPIKALLSDKAVQVADGEGKVICDIWLRKQVPVKANAQEIAKGLNYRQVEQSTVVGAARFGQEWTDFRKQKIKPGVYTLRIGYQPMDGDHMGTAPYTEFCLLAPAAHDKKPDLLEPKALHELSEKAVNGGSHPSVMLLFPNPKPDAEPKMAGKGNGIWVLNCKEDALAGDQKAVLGFGLTLFGVTTAE